MEPETPQPTLVHASCVTLRGSGVLITGASGAGKSALALALMGMGARLVADDRVILSRVGDRVIASCPPAISGLIEARGIGLLRADPEPQAAVALAIDLDRAETDRLPAARETVLLGVALPLLNRVDAPHFAAAILQFLKAGRQDST